MIADQFAEIAQNHARLFSRPNDAVSNRDAPSPSILELPRDQYTQIMTDDELADALAA